MTDPETPIANTAQEVSRTEAQNRVDQLMVDIADAKKDFDRIMSGLKATQTEKIARYVKLVAEVTYIKGLADQAKFEKTAP